MRIDVDKLKAAARRAGVLQADIARSAGWSESYVSELFGGKYRGNARTWAALASAVGVEVDEIITDQPDQPDQPETATAEAGGA